jgi:hypothetical protein
MQACVKQSKKCALYSVLLCCTVNRNVTRYDTYMDGEWKGWNRRCSFVSAEKTEKSKSMESAMLRIRRLNTEVAL